MIVVLLWLAGEGCRCCRGCCCHCCHCCRGCRGCCRHCCRGCRGFCRRGRFEVESREIFSSRDEVLKAVGLKAGQVVADIGAGTGFFAKLFSSAVGDDGHVFAVDISPVFLKHLRQRVKADELTNVSVIPCREDSVTLSPDSVDVAFICDTYHHFEFPQATMTSLYNAMRPGGQLIVIDFERIPGKSRDWTLSHVRAGKNEFRQEIEQIGFRFVGEQPIAGFEENYFLRFQR